MPALECVQGTHLVLPGTLARGIYYLESPHDGRAVFVIPWKGNVMVGTTETPYVGDPALVAPTPAETHYLLGVLKHYFPRWRTINESDLIESFAGLRFFETESFGDLIDGGRLIGGVDDGFERGFALVGAHRAGGFRRRTRSSRLGRCCCGCDLGRRLLPRVRTHLRRGFGLRVVTVELLGILVHYLYSSSIWRSPPDSSNTSSKLLPFFKTISPNCFS